MKETKNSAFEIRKCKSGFIAVRVHYSIDPKLWPAERIASIKSAIPGWRWQKEYEIDFNARGGQKVYDCFDPLIHVGIPEIDIDACPRYKVIDHGRRNPTACLWWAEDRKSKIIFFYREYYQPNATIAEHSRNILALERKNETRMTLIDPSTHKRLDTSSTTIADEYTRYGIKTVAADNNLSAGIEEVSSALLASLARWSIENHTIHNYFEQRLINKQRLFVIAEQRAVYFHPSMTNTIRELTQLSWEQSADNDANKPLCERIVNVDDHAADCVRYALLRPRIRQHGIRAKNIKRI